MMYHFMNDILLYNISLQINSSVRQVVVYWIMLISYQWLVFVTCYKPYLQYIPAYEKAIIFGENWFTNEWKPSKQVVCARGDACLIPLIREFFVKALHTFLYNSEPAKINVPASLHPYKITTLA